MADDAEKKPSPSRWWQWFLIYPAMAVAMIGAIPTVIQQVKAWRLEVNYNEVAKVEEQRLLWERNVACLTTSGLYEVDAYDGGVIGVTLCPTGDVLLRYQYKEENTRYVWVKSPRPYKQSKYRTTR